MIRREVAVRRTLDPRLNTIIGPKGNKYYYDMQTGTILQSERLYEETRGGILADYGLRKDPDLPFRDPCHERSLG